MSLPFPVYEIDAESAFERGVQHGEQARAQVLASIETYRGIFKNFVDLDWAEALRLAESFREPIGRFDAGLLEEMEGVAAGAGVDFADVLTLNARSEIVFTARMAEGCTAFAAFGRATRDGTTILCQNWDWRSMQRAGLCILLLEQPGKPRITMLTEGGIVGKIGFNSTGLGVCLNAVVTDEVKVDGTPLHIVLRGILESRTLGDAIETVGRAGIASAANFVLAQHGNGALDVEAIAGDFEVLLPDHDVVAHTNHLLHPRLQLAARDLGKQALPDSYPRLARVRRLLEERWGLLDEQAAQEILRDHANEPDSICRHEDEVVDPPGKRIESVFSMIMNLERQTLHMTEGPPCASAYASALPELATR